MLLLPGPSKSQEQKLEVVGKNEGSRDRKSVV